MRITNLQKLLLVLIFSVTVLSTSGMCLSATDGPFLKALPLERGGKAFAADPAGNVRMNIIFKNFNSTGERALLLSRKGRLIHNFSSFPAATLEVHQDELLDAVVGIEADPNVLLVEPDPADQRIQWYSVPWGIKRIKAKSLHSLTGRQGAGVKVAVLDTGIEYTHPDLNGNYKGGYDFVNMDTNPRDDHGHGTHVAGTITAIKNTIGVVGAAPSAWLYSVKVLDEYGWGYHSDFAAGINWCIQKNIKVVNYSAGGDGSSILRMACDSAYQAGLVVVAAVGNEGRSGICYPAAYDTVLAVGASDFNNKRAYFSNYGQKLDLVAPGVDVLSTIIYNGYGEWDGTSMAAPHVSGTAALMIEKGITDPAEVFDRLRMTATDLGKAGRDDFYGYGLVNAFAAVMHEEFILSPNGGEVVPSGSSFPVLWNIPGDAVSYRLKYSINNGSKWKVIQKDVVGTGYDWLVPAPARNRKKALLKITAYDAGGVVTAVDTSDSPFKIEVVKIDYPNGGEILTSGELNLVSWSVNKTKNPVAKIKLYYTKNGGDTWIRIAVLPAGSESFEWLVPEVPRVKSKCRVKIVLKDDDGKLVGKDSSDNYFTIQPSVP